MVTATLCSQGNWRRIKSTSSLQSYTTAIMQLSNPEMATAGTRLFCSLCWFMWTKDDTTAWATSWSIAYLQYLEIAFSQFPSPCSFPDRFHVVPTPRAPVFCLLLAAPICRGPACGLRCLVSFPAVLLAQSLRRSLQLDLRSVSSTSSWCTHHFLNTSYMLGKPETMWSLMQLNVVY